MYCSESLVRTATPDDAPNLAALMIQVWLHTYATQGLRDAISSYVLAQFTVDKVRAALASPTQHWFVAEIDAHLVGLAALDWDGLCPATHRPMPALQKLYVQEHFTHKGIGTRLLQAAMESCRARSLDTLWLTVQPQNRRAVQFYERNGFRMAGLTNFVLGDELHENHVLHKALDKRPAMSNGGLDDLLDS